MAGKRPDLFEDVLEDDLAGRPASGRQRLGGASLRADEFAKVQGPEELDSRFHQLQAEERAIRAQRGQADATRRTRWTGTFWLLAAVAAAGLAAVGRVALQRSRARAAQAALVRANAERRQADEERLLRIQEVAPAAPNQRAAH